jgi:hypothetical protein
VEERWQADEPYDKEQFVYSFLIFPLHHLITACCFFRETTSRNNLFSSPDAQTGKYSQTTVQSRSAKGIISPGF